MLWKYILRRYRGCARLLGWGVSMKYYHFHSCIFKESPNLLLFYSSFIDSIFDCSVCSILHPPTCWDVHRFASTKVVTLTFPRMFIWKFSEILYFNDLVLRQILSIYEQMWGDRKIVWKAGITYIISDVIAWLKCHNITTFLFCLPRSFLFLTKSTRIKARYKEKIDARYIAHKMWRFSYLCNSVKYCIENPFRFG